MLWVILIVVAMTLLVAWGVYEQQQESWNQVQRYSETDQAPKGD